MKNPVKLKQAVIDGKMAQQEINKLKSIVKKGKKAQDKLNAFDGKITKNLYSDLLELSLLEATVEMRDEANCVYVGRAGNSYVISGHEMDDGAIHMSVEKLSLNKNLEPVYATATNFTIPHRDRLIMLRHGLRDSDSYNVHRYGKAETMNLDNSRLYDMAVLLVPRSSWVGMLDDSEVIAMQESEEGVIVDIYTMQTMDSPVSFTVPNELTGVHGLPHSLMMLSGHFKS